jgi:hypothetical protein
MDGRHRFENELRDLQLREFQVAPAAKPATVGFEFDVHYGLIEEVVTDAGKTMPANGSDLTDHKDATDGFRVKLDGPRLEIATKPFTVDASGAADRVKVAGRIEKLANELLKGCRDAKEKNIVVTGLDGNPVRGKPRPFVHSRTLVKDLPLAKLIVRGKFTNCSVWGSPQATVTVPLSKVGALVTEIFKSEGKGPGVAMTGSARARDRMGVRSDAIYKAKAAVEKSRKAILAAKPPMKLSDGTVVDAKAFTENVSGLLILMVSYLWTSELTYDPKGDYEPFAKAYLPVNVKAPFSKICSTLLTTTELNVFKELFASKTARVRLFQMVIPGITAAAGGSRKLFPPGPEENGLDSVHERQKAEFGSVPTWNDFLDHTLDPTHKSWGDRLLVPLSKPIDLGKTKPRVPLELRRFGFTSVDHGLWKEMMRRVFDMVKRLNA